MRTVITRSCGHDEEIQVFGPIKNRPAQIARAAGQVCRPCFMAAREQLRQEENAEATRQTATLPPLDGTEKQIVWANTIRWKAILDIWTWVNPILQHPKRDYLRAAIHAVDPGLLEYLRQNPGDHLIWGVIADALEELGMDDHRVFRVIAWVFAQTSCRWWIDEGRYGKMIVQKKVKESKSCS